MYQYCYGDPVNWIDLSGLGIWGRAWSLAQGLFLGGAVIAQGFHAATAYLSGSFASGVEYAAGTAEQTFSDAGLSGAADVASAVEETTGNMATGAQQTFSRDVQSIGKSLAKNEKHLRDAFRRP